MNIFAILIAIGIASNGVLARKDERCPLLNDPNKAIHIPHEKRCNLFYTCNWGETLLFECPANLHWSVEKNICDYPENVKCEVGKATKDEEAAVENSDLDPRCPLVNDYDETIHLPHEDDCTKFYKCDWGRAVLQECPDGLHFNAELSVCDWPESAKCDAAFVGFDENSAELDTRCPTFYDYSETIHLAHESDCNKFYICNWGEAVVHYCPEGLHFNPKYKVCDWPRSARCAGN